MEAVIHVAGVIPRMGATTLALQLVCFLQENGYDACYAEMSRQNYIWAAANIYQGAALDRATGKTTCMGVEMFGSERARALRDGSLPYDYVVCDFGNLADPAFDRQQFTGGDCQILLCGNKPNEIFQTEDALKDPLFTKALTVFNFTDPADYGEIRKMMMGRAATTDFMPYIPDPFHAGQEYTKGEFFRRLMDMVLYIACPDGGQ